MALQSPVLPEDAATLGDIEPYEPGKLVAGDASNQPGDLMRLSRDLPDAHLGQQHRVELIFDPKTSALLAEQTVLVNTRTRTSTVTSWTVYLKSGVVDSVNSTKLVSGRGGGPA